MPEIDLEPGYKLFYRDDDVTDPWKQRETAVMFHGFAESGLAWNAWMPYLTRRFRVLRPDMRGFGRSTPMPSDYPWSVEGLIADFARFADRLGVERFHLFGAKVGGGLAMRFAATHPNRVQTLTVTGAYFLSGTNAASGMREQIDQIIHDGTAEHWARRTMARRLGSDCDPEMSEGWVALMAATPLSTMTGFLNNVPGIDLGDDLPRIAAPTLAIMNSVGEGSATVEDTRERARLIPRGELMVLPVESSHVAATHPDTCARAALAFIDRVAAASTA